MTDPLTLLWACVAGAALGAIFFGGLWLTVRECASSRRPGLLFAASLLLRMGIALTGFYLVCAGRWERLVLCLFGFVIARLLVTRLVRRSDARPRAPLREAGHAP